MLPSSPAPASPASPPPPLPPGASPAPGASPPPPPPPPPDCLSKIEARILSDLRDPTGLALVHTDLPIGYDSAGGATTEGS